MPPAVQRAKEKGLLKSVLGYLIFGALLVRISMELGDHRNIAWGFAAVSGMLIAYNLLMISGRKSTVAVVPTLFGSMAAVVLVEPVPMKIMVIAALAGLDLGLLPAWSRVRQKQK